jgi:hypothetical protein
MDTFSDGPGAGRGLKQLNVTEQLVLQPFASVTTTVNVPVVDDKPAWNVICEEFAPLLIDHPLPVTDHK